jgi:hypothetical protein
MTYLELTARQTEIHARALRLSREHRELEAKLCECLREIDETKLFKKLGWPSLFIYATRELRLTEAIAYAFISVARKSREIPELKVAIEERTLSVAKASRMVSGLNLENAGELIDFAKTRSTRELEAELARRNPEILRRDRVRPIAGDSIELRAYLPKSVRLKLERVTALLAQKGKPINLATAIESALDEYLKHHDPVEKARRAEARAARRRHVPQHNLSDRLGREAKCAEERLANEKSLSQPAPAQSQRSRLGQESKPSQVPELNQSPRLDQGPLRDKSSVIDHKLALGQGATLRKNSVVGHEPLLKQGSRCENTRSVSSSRGSIPNLNSILSRSLNLNSNLKLNPIPSPNHDPDTNKTYLLRTRKVFAETQLTQSDFSPGDDLTKLNSLVARSQNPVSDEKFALNRSRDLSEKHTMSHTQPSSQTLSCRSAPHRRPLQKHIQSPKQLPSHKPASEPQTRLTSPAAFGF